MRENGEEIVAVVNPVGVIFEAGLRLRVTAEVIDDLPMHFKQALRCSQTEIPIVDRLARQLALADVERRAQILASQAFGRGECLHK